MGLFRGNHEQHNPQQETPNQQGLRLLATPAPSCARMLRAEPSRPEDGVVRRFEQISPENPKPGISPMVVMKKGGSPGFLRLCMRRVFGKYTGGCPQTLGLFIHTIA